MRFHITKYPLIAARIYWLSILLALIFPPIIEVNFVITILVIRDLFLKLNFEDHRNTKGYLVASLFTHLIWLISITLGFLLANQISELLIIVMLIGSIIGFGLILLFLYYFQTRLNKHEDFEGVDVWDLIVTPWFLQQWGKTLTN